MKLFFGVTFFTFFSLYSLHEYQLSFDKFLTGSIRFDLDLYNNTLDKNFFYSGSIEDIDDILNIHSQEKAILKKGSHPLVYILNKNYIQYINLFPKNTIFIILEEFFENLTKNNKDYIIFTMGEEEKYEFIVYSAVYKSEHLYYVKLGKQLDGNMKKNIYFILFFNIFISISISIIMRKVIKKVDEEFLLPIHSLIIAISEILTIINFCNSLSFIIFRYLEFNFVTEYMTLFIYTFYKSIFYTTVLVILLGWTIISFFGWESTFKNLSKKILLYDLLFFIFIIIFIYFGNITHQLKLFHIKNATEHLFLLIVNIYCFFKKLIPIFNQLNYEQSIRSDRVKCLRFKLRRLSLLSIGVLAYTITFLNTPILDKKYIYRYVDNFSIHIVFQLFYENIFFIYFVIIFYPKTLPMYYFEDIVFNYKAKVFLLANISEENDGDKKLNISNLTANKLTKIAKKENYPIVFINPFTSPKNSSFFNEIYIGIANLAEKDI